MEIKQIIVLCVFAVMTVVGFVTMYVDKQKAKKNKWRIPEATLFIIAFLFGGVGTTAGMTTFRHKTQHWYFKVFMPIAAIFSVAVTVLLFIIL